MAIVGVMLYTGMMECFQVGSEIHPDKSLDSYNSSTGDRSLIIIGSQQEKWDNHFARTKSFSIIGDMGHRPDQQYKNNYNKKQIFKI